MILIATLTIINIKYVNECYSDFKCIMKNNTQIEAMFSPNAINVPGSEQPQASEETKASHHPNGP